MQTIADELGVSESAVSLWLSGKNKPTKTAVILGSILAERDG